LKEKQKKLKSSGSSNNEPCTINTNMKKLPILPTIFEVTKEDITKSLQTSVARLKIKPTLHNQD
jgi:hypothetical protein